MNNEACNIPRSHERSPKRKEAGDVSEIIFAVGIIGGLIGGIFVASREIETISKKEKYQASICKIECSSTQTVANLLTTALDECPSDNCCLRAEKHLSDMRYSLGVTETVCDQTPMSISCRNTINAIVEAEQKKFRDICLRAQGLSPQKIRRENANSGN